MRAESRIAFSCKLSACSPSGHVVVKVKKNGDVDRLQKAQIARLTPGRRMQLVLVYVGGGVGVPCQARHGVHMDDFHGIDSMTAFLSNCLLLRGSHVTVKLATVIPGDAPLFPLTVTSVAEAEVHLAMDPADDASDSASIIALREVRLHPVREPDSPRLHLASVAEVLAAMPTLRPYGNTFLTDAVASLFERRQLLLRGPTGAGKTHLARAIAFALALGTRADAPAALFSSAADLDQVLSSSPAVEIVQVLFMTSPSNQ